MILKLVVRIKNHVENQCKRRMPEKAIGPSKKMKQTTLLRQINSHFPMNEYQLDVTNREKQKSLSKSF